jgi:RNA polymerase sigma factor (sigma-70 family)
MADREARADADLVAAARAGDKDAFAVLIDRHRPAVFVVVRRLLGNAAAAGDAAQEAAVTALVALDRLRSPERFGAWYAGIALNVARRWLRDTVATGPLSEEWPDSRPAPDEQIEAAELARDVRRAVQRLAPGQRRAVLAFYWQGLTHAEAALELGISPGAVKSRLHQGRAALAPELASCMPPTEEVLIMPGPAEPTWIEVEVVEIRRSGGEDPTRRLHVVVLKERGGDRRLPIYTGAAEAVALACNLETVEMPRPMTYKLAASLIEAGGSQVAEVRITRLAESTFYAAVLVEGATGRAEVDARPSDALNLALVCGTPIRVDATVFGHPDAVRHVEWQQFPTGAQQLVTEMRDLNLSSSPPCWGANDDEHP